MTEETKAERKLGRWTWLWLVAAVYAIWFGWLVYVAWVNTRAGNQ